MNKDTEKKVVELQTIEQNLQSIIMQKQQFQSQSAETENALREVKETKDKVYKVIGNTMISVEKSKVEKDLSSKKEIFDLRIKNIEKQEKQLKEKFEALQSEVLKNIKK